MARCGGNSPAPGGTHTAQEPKKVSDLTQFCEERDLMLNVRGDGSARSQQTRLGKALAAKRDRVFNGLTVKRIEQGKHKTGVLLCACVGEWRQTGWDFFAGTWTSWICSDGDVDADGGDVGGDVADKRPHPLEPNRSNQLADDGGDVGDVGDLFQIPRAQKTLSHTRIQT